MEKGRCRAFLHVAVALKLLSRALAFCLMFPRLVLFPFTSAPLMPNLLDGSSIVLHVPCSFFDSSRGSSESFLFFVLTLSVPPAEVMASWIF